MRVTEMAAARIDPFFTKQLSRLASENVVTCFANEGYFSAEAGGCYLLVSAFTTRVHERFFSDDGFAGRRDVWAVMNMSVLELSAAGI